MWTFIAVVIALAIGFGGGVYYQMQRDPELGPGRTAKRIRRASGDN
jgi:hypothetical protein